VWVGPGSTTAALLVHGGGGGPLRACAVGLPHAAATATATAAAAAAVSHATGAAGDGNAGASVVRIVTRMVAAIGDHKDRCSGARRGPRRVHPKNVFYICAILGYAFDLRIN